MPRTLNATLLAAMESGNYTPIIRAWVSVNGTKTSTQIKLLYYKLDGVELEIKISQASAASTPSIMLERGALVGGVEYTIFSSEFTPYEGTYKDGIYTLKCHLLWKEYISLGPDKTYSQFISSFCIYDAAFIPQYRDPAAAWLSYLFLPAGRGFTSNNLLSAFTLLKQKYLIHAADYGAQKIYFFSVADTLAASADYTITSIGLEHTSHRSELRRLMSRDENNTVHYSGSGPIFNLGFLPSTASHPVIPAAGNHHLDTVLIVRPNLKYLTGDCVLLALKNAATTQKLVLRVVEIFDPSYSPSWRMELSPLEYFTNTEGGSLPSTLEALSPYTPLNVSKFNNILDSTDNNLQAAMETIDDHAHAALYAPIAKGVTNGDSHDHVGGDGAQIDHGGLAGLGDDDHTQYIKHSLATATDDFLAASGSGAYVKKTAAETKTILGLTVPSYTAPSMLNSWVNFGAGYSTAGYAKDVFGRVWIKGFIKSGTIGLAVFQLPAGYRPGTAKYFPVCSIDAYGEVLIDTSGNVSVQVGNNIWVSLDGIWFDSA